MLFRSAYIIFDYQSPTDFKFSGVDISIDKMVMGHRDASGWNIDVQVPAQLKPDQDYNVLLAVNGVTATVNPAGKCPLNSNPTWFASSSNKPLNVPCCRRRCSAWS